MNGTTKERYEIIIKMLQNIVKYEGIKNAKIDILDGYVKGEGYAGEKHLANLYGDNKTMELFVKGAPTNEAYKKVCNLRLMFLCEILFYKDIIPIYFDFQRRKNIAKPFTSVLKCVESCIDVGNEIIIMENAKSLGYKMWDKKLLMNQEHVNIAFVEFGKLHGLAYALKDQHPEIYQGILDKFPGNVLEEIGEGFIPGLQALAEKGKLLLCPEKQGSAYECYSKYVDSMPEFQRNLVHQKDEYSIIIHGDAWSSNIMFKYDDHSNQSIPKQMILLDFQMIREGSPVLDIAYLMYACASKEVYNNLNHHLQIYYDSLSRTIRDLGSNPEVLFPFEVLKHQWEIYAKFGLTMAVLNLKASIQEDDEVLDMTEGLEQSGGTDMLAGFTKDCRNEELYHQRLKELIIHMIDCKFI